MASTKMTNGSVCKRTHETVYKRERGCCLSQRKASAVRRGAVSLRRNPYVVPYAAFVLHSLTLLELLSRSRTLAVCCVPP